MNCVRLRRWCAMTRHSAFAIEFEDRLCDVNGHGRSIHLGLPLVALIHLSECGHDDASQPGGVHTIVVKVRGSRTSMRIVAVKFVPFSPSVVFFVLIEANLHRSRRAG